MNREMKRMLQRQGELGADGQPIAAQPKQPRLSAKRRGRRSPLTFLREVRAELRKVVWATRDELKNYSIVVLVTLAFMIAFILLLDQMFQQASLYLFK